MSTDSPLINAADDPSAGLTPPEPFVAELEPFLIYPRIEILANLRLLIDQRVLATVYFNQGADAVITRILGINPELEELIFDPAPDDSANRALQASSELTVVSSFEHIKVQFTLERAELVRLRGTLVFRARLPRAILRLQRRTAFRASPHIANSPHVLLSPAPDETGKTVTARLRIADISVSGLAFVAPMGWPILRAGMRLRGCRLELIADQAFDVEIEIRRVSVFKDGFGRDMCRAGCRLLGISSHAEMAIQRYVNLLAVTERHHP